MQASSRALSMEVGRSLSSDPAAAAATAPTESQLLARRVLVPLIEKKLDGFVLWFFANKEKLEAQARGEACPHHDNPDDCPSKNDASHACPFTRQAEQAKAVASASWTAEECSEAEAKVEKEITKAEQQLHKLEHALGPYARGERNAFRAPLRLTRDHQVVEVDAFDKLLELYHDDYAAAASESDSQRLVLELTTKFLQAAEADFEHVDDSEAPITT
jgi:hypothetical protein